jgi:acetyl-CoA acetyltransferase family protein
MTRYNVMELPMGNTAEKVAEKYNVARDDMENMAVWSHKKAAAARDAGKFAKEIVPVMGVDDAGNEFLVDKDQWVRDTMDPEKMKTMMSPFKPDGVVTAATSSPLTQGACALLMMSRKKADELGLSYSYKYSAGAFAGVDPTVMGIGPVEAVKRLMDKTGVTFDQVGAIELNEAFACQALACIRELGMDKENAPFDKVNMWGGAIALGHPLGESGARVIVTLLNVLATDVPDAKYGMATLCGGFGNAAAVLVEKVG